MTARRLTWMEVALRNGGFRKAPKAFVYAYCWAIVQAAEGHDPTAEEVAAWWRSPVRSVYREQAAFRACFPTLDSPAPLYDSPEGRKAVEDGVQFGRKLDERQARRRASPETAALTVGMLPAPPSAVA